MKNEHRYTRAPVTLPLIRVDFAITIRRFDQCRATGHDRRWSASGGDPKSWYFPPQITITLLVGARQAVLTRSRYLALYVIISRCRMKFGTGKHIEANAGGKGEREREYKRWSTGCREGNRGKGGREGGLWTVQLVVGDSTSPIYDRRTNFEPISFWALRTMRSKSSDLLARVICSDVLSPLVESVVSSGEGYRLEYARNCSMYAEWT